MRITPGPTSWVEIGSRANPTCGDRGKDDFRWGDWVGRDPDFDAVVPRVPWWISLSPFGMPAQINRAAAVAALRARYNERRGWANEKLIEEWLYWFDVLGTGQLGVAMITRFVRGTGQAWTHQPDSELSRDMFNVRTVRNTREQLFGLIEERIRWQRQAGFMDASRLQVPVTLQLSTSMGDLSYTPKLRALVGGIQGVRIYAKNLRVNPPMVNNIQYDYLLDLRMVICDNFGVGADDLYQDALISMWILQHQRTAAPFVNYIAMDFTVGGRF